MTSEIKRLQEAFLQKEQNQNFLANLERLKAQGSVKDEQYKTLKAGYQEKLTTAISEIANIKSQLKNQLQRSEQELVSLRGELETLIAEHTAGRLTEQKYNNSQKELVREITHTDNLIAYLQRLVAAKSSADIETIPPRADLPPAVRKQAIGREVGTIPQGKVNLTFSGKGEDILGRVLLWGILTLVTLGIYSPWAINNLYRYIIEHVKVDMASQSRVNIVYKGKGEDILGRILLWGILTLVTLGIYSPWAINNLYRYIIEHTNVEVY